MNWNKYNDNLEELPSQRKRGEHDLYLMVYALPVSLNSKTPHSCISLELCGIPYIHEYERLKKSDACRKILIYWAEIKVPAEFNSKTLRY